MHADLADVLCGPDGAVPCGQAPMDRGLTAMHLLRVQTLILDIAVTVLALAVQRRCWRRRPEAKLTAPPGRHRP